MNSTELMSGDWHVGSISTLNPVGSDSASPCSMEEACVFVAEEQLRVHSPFPPLTVPTGLSWIMAKTGSVRDALKRTVL